MTSPVVQTIPSLGQTGVPKSNVLLSHVSRPLEPLGSATADGETIATLQTSMSSNARVAMPETPRKVVTPAPKATIVALPKSREVVETSVPRRVATPLAKPFPVSTIEATEVPSTPSRKANVQKSSEERDEITILPLTVSKNEEVDHNTEKGKESTRIDNVWATKRATPKKSTEIPTEPIVADIEFGKDYNKVSTKAIDSNSFDNDKQAAQEPVVQPFQRPNTGKLRITTSPTRNDKTAGHPNTSKTAAYATSSESRPSTPNVGDASIRRTVPARTLRITDTPKTETPTPVVPNPSNAAPVPQAASSSKVSSRRPSLTSTAQPGTPLSERVELSSVASASRTPSRATSPAPVAKKRIEKAKVKKQLQKKKEDEEAILSPTVEEQSPILARKKKMRKPGTGSAGPSRVTSTALSRPETPADGETKSLNDEQEPPQTVALDENQEQPVQTPDEPVEIQAPKPKRSQNVSDGISLLEDANFLLMHPINNPVSMAGHLKNLSDARPFSTSTDIANYLMYHPNSQTAESRIPYNHSPKEAFTPEQYSMYIHNARSAGDPIRLASRDGRLSGQYIETPRGTRLLGLTTSEQERLLELEATVCATPGASFWGGGNASYLPDVPMLKSRNKQYSTDEAVPLLPSLRLPSGVVLLDPNREIAERDPALLVNQPLFATTNVADPRIKSGSSGSSVIADPRPQPDPQQQQLQEPLSASSTLPAHFYDQQQHLHHHHHHHHHHASYAGSGSAAARAQLPPLDDPSLAGARDPATASMFDKLERVAGGAKKAAAAIGGTHEILRRAIGTEDESLRWREQVEVEKKNAAEIERRLNAAIKRNRKMVLGGKA